MIKVTIAEDAAVISSVTDKYTPSLRMAWAQENEFARGYCLFDMSGEIVFVRDNDSIFELLIRAALNYLDNRGVKESFCANVEYTGKLKSLGFVKDEGIAKVNIREFFKPCCEGRR
ncbi:MAG: hypothetical protein Q4C12_04125 [Clostridia bacterium]|nr:hypothetical protein [Clostridia bacterium]